MNPADEQIIVAEGLTRRFAGVTAVADVSFAIGRGEIVGLLGPNGAGKTTTIRMLTGFLTPTEGRVRIAGRDVLDDADGARRAIGYLPENVPLYPELRVDEYLRFRARLKGVPARGARAAVERVRALCGLEDMGRRVIGQLSKGYRQRVGLADALVHDPAVVILDEPTIGLDPNQIRQVRELIRGLAERHTVLLSTHILSEVEMTCGRVLILHHGRIVASGAPEGLIRRLQCRAGVAAELRAPSAAEALRVLETVPGVAHAEVAEAAGGWLRARLECAGVEDIRPAVFRAAVERGWILRELTAERQTLEDVFTELTQENGQDAEFQIPNAESGTRKAGAGI